MESTVQHVWVPSRLIPPPLIPSSPLSSQGRCLQLGSASEASAEGKVRGRLLGGNLTVLCSLIGSPACERALGRMRCGRAEHCGGVRGGEGEGGGERAEGGEVCMAEGRTSCGGRGDGEEGVILLLEDGE